MPSKDTYLTFDVDIDDASLVGDILEKSLW